MIDETLFKDVMARIPKPVAVITTATELGYHGITVSSFGSLSLHPPLMYTCIFHENQSHDRLFEVEAFAVNVLARKHTFYAEQFAGQTPLADPAFSRVAHSLSSSGIPLIDDCVSWIECRPWTNYPGGDHTIFIGEIERITMGEADDPLIYYNREFVELAW